MMKDSQYWIDRLNLKKHPEGGYFCETYRCAETIDSSALPARYSGNRAFSTAIYYLLPAGECSRFHRIRSDETWHYYCGDTLLLYLGKAGERIECRKLGMDPEKGESFQITVPAGTWMAAEVDGDSGFTMLGCTVSPGFDPVDFELAERESLLDLFPDDRLLIERLTGLEY